MTDIEINDLEDNNFVLTAYGNVDYFSILNADGLFGLFNTL